MVGNTALGLSLDFAHYARAWSIQSEFTLNQRGSTAFATFLRCQLSSTDVLLLQLRHFSAHNAAPAARTFQQGAHVQNEWGGLLGYETAFGRKFHWQSFLQFDHHPLPTWRAAAPSSGFVWQTLFTYAPHRTQQWSLRYRLTSRQQTIPQHAPLLQWVTRQSLRLLYQRSFGDFSLQTAADATASRQQLQGAMHYGAMLSLRLRYAPQTACTLQVLSACFLATVSPRVFMPINPNCRVQEPSPVFTARGGRGLLSCRGLPLVLGLSPLDWLSLIIGTLQLLPFLPSLLLKQCRLLPPCNHHLLLLSLSIVAYG